MGVVQTTTGNRDKDRIWYVTGDRDLRSHVHGQVPDVIDLDVLDLNAVDAVVDGRWSTANAQE